MTTTPQSITDQTAQAAIQLQFSALVMRGVAVTDATALTWRLILQDVRSSTLEVDYTNADTEMDVSASAITVTLDTAALGLTAGVTYTGELWGTDDIGIDRVKKFLLQLQSTFHP